MLCSMWDLSSWARDQTLTSCLRSVSLTLQARPTFSFCWWFPLLCSVLILCLHVIMHAWVKAVVPGDSTRMPIAYVQCEPLYGSAWDTITKHQRLGSLNSTTLFSHGAGAQKSKITVLVGMVSSETSLTYNGRPLLPLHLVIPSVAWHS